MLTDQLTAAHQFLPLINGYMPATIISLLTQWPAHRGEWVKVIREDSFKEHHMKGPS